MGIPNTYPSLSKMLMIGKLSSKKKSMKMANKRCALICFNSSRS